MGKLPTYSPPSPVCIDGSTAVPPQREVCNHYRNSLPVLIAVDDEDIVNCSGSTSL